MHNQNSSVFGRGKLNRPKNLDSAPLKHAVSTAAAPAAIGPYSQGIAAVNEVYARSFSAPFPARSCVQVAALPRGARLEVEAIAVRATD